MNWKEIAADLPINGKTRVKCCGKNRDAVIGHDYKGYSFYCFKCGLVEIENFKVRNLYHLLNIKELNEQAELELELPSDFTRSIPIQFACWLFKAGLDTDAYMEKGIGWSAELQRIIIPMYSDTNQLLYFQCRAVHKGQLPKYKNPSVSKAHLLYRAGETQNKQRIVVTEDILSCIRVGKHISSCSLLGTKTSDEQAGILSAYDLVSYWLDPDKAGIKGAREGYRKLILATNVEILASKVDPKHLSDREIRQVLHLSPNKDYIYHGCITPQDT